MAKLVQSGTSEVGVGNRLKRTARIEGDAAHFDPMRRKLDIKGIQTQLIRTLTRVLLESV